MTTYCAHIDGGARGDPGPGGWGAVIADGAGTVVAQLSGALPHVTSSAAEYRGLIEALKWCAAHGASSVAIRSDSLLVVEQMRSAYQVKHEELKPLHGAAKLLAHRIGRVTYEHIRRELNNIADGLTNKAIDEAAAGNVAPAPGPR